KEHPSRYFLSKAQAMDRLEELMIKLNNTPKDGEYHKGRTPKEVYEATFTTKLEFIPDEFSQYFKSNEIRNALVTRNGLRFEFGRQIFRYKDSHELGSLKGARVLVRFSPENPSTCVVVHDSLQKPLVVPREPLCSHFATDEELALRHRACANFDSYYKELYRSLQPAFSADFKA